MSEKDNEHSPMSENKLHLNPEGNEGKLLILEDFSVKDVSQSVHEKSENGNNELISKQDELLNDEMELSLSENICSLERKSDKAVENVDMYNENDNFLKVKVNHEVVPLDEKQKCFIKRPDIQINNSQKLIIDHSNNQYIVDVGLKDISPNDYYKAGNREKNDRNRESETFGNQNIEATIYSVNSLVNHSQETDETFNSIKSCVDAILDDICVTEKINELIVHDFIKNNREKLEILSQELSTLNRNHENNQVKKDNTCDMFGVNHNVISTEEKQFSKPLNEELDMSSKKSIDACNSEKNNFDSMVNNIVMKDISVDNIRSGNRDITEPDSFGYREVSEIFDDVLCVDMTHENVSLIEEKTELINDDFVVKNREQSEAINRKLSKLGEKLQKDKIKDDNYNAFEVNDAKSLDYEQKNVTKSKNIKINSSSKQKICECCSLVKKNFHSDGNNIVMKDVSENNEEIDKRGVAKPEMKEYSNNKDSVNYGTNYFINYKECSEVNDDAVSCVDMILENVSLIKEKNNLIIGDFVLNNRETSEEVIKEFSKLSSSIQEDQMKYYDCNALGVNYAISSNSLKNAIKQEDTEINNIDNQDIMHDISEVNDDVSCVDMILENVNLIKEKSNLIINDFVVSNRETSEEVIKEFSKLSSSIQEDQMKCYDCDALGVNYVNSSNKLKNVIEQEDTEINNIDNQDIIMHDIFEFNGIVGEKDIAEPEKKEHQNSKDNVNNNGNYFINDSKKVEEKNDDVSSVEMIHGNNNLANDKIDLIIRDFITSNKENAEEINQALNNLDRSFQENPKKCKLCDAFRLNYAIISEEKQSFIKSLNTETNNSGIEYSNSEKDNCDTMDVSIIIEDISKDNERDVKIDGTIGVSKPGTPEHKNSGASVDSVDNSFINKYKEIAEINSNVELRSDIIIQNLNLSKKEIELMNDDITMNRKEVEEDSQELLNKFGKSYPKTQMKEDENCSISGVSHAIKSDVNFRKPLDAEINLDNVDASLKIILPESEKANYTDRGIDNAETEPYEQQNTGDNICGSKINVISNNGEVCETDDDIKLSCPLPEILSVTENENELIDVDLVNNREKSENKSQKLSKLDKSFEKNQMQVSNYDVLGENHVINSNLSFDKSLDTKMNDSHVQNTDSYRNSEKYNFISNTIDSTEDCGKEEYKNRDINNVQTKTREQHVEDSISNDKSIVMNSNEIINEPSDNAKSSDLAVDPLAENVTELNNVDFIANNGKSEAFSQELNMVCENIQKDQTKVENNCIVLESHTSSSKEKHKDFIKPFDAYTSNLCEQNTDVCNNLEKNNFSSVIDINLQTATLEEQSTASQSDKNRDNVIYETQKYPIVKTNICDGNTSFCNAVSEISDKKNTCIDTIQIKNNNNEKLREITPLQSKHLATSEDSEVIIVYDNECDDCDYEILKEDYIPFNNEKTNLNTDVKSREKFNEELDNELVILKDQYSVIESKLVSASKSLSAAIIYKFIEKMKKELTSCVQSLEKLKIKCKSKWLRTKAETTNVRVGSFGSYHQQYPESNFETPIDKYRYRSQACTKLRTTISDTSRLYQKIESHHFYEYNSKMSPRETVKRSHTFRQSPEIFSSSENETSKNLHKNECKLSHYKYERSFQRFPDDKSNSRTARDSKDSYRNQLDCYAEVGGFSKSFFAHKKYLFDKSAARDSITPDSSYSNRALKGSVDNNFALKSHCCRKKVDETRNKKKLKSRKYGRKYDMYSDSCSSSEISSDSELTSIHSDHYDGYDKYCNRTSQSPKYIKKDKATPGRERSRKRKHKRDSYSTCSSDSSVRETESVFEKRHDKETPYERDIENKRVQGLMGRQMAVINKHVSRKDNMVKSPEYSFNPPNVIEEYKRKKYSCKGKFSEDDTSSSTSNDVLSIHESEKMRKKKSHKPFTTSCKLDLSSHTDDHNILKNKHNKTSSVMKSPPFNQPKRRNYADEEDIFENKYNIQSCKRKFQTSVMSPSRISSSPVKTKRLKADKETWYSSKASRGQVVDHNDTKCNSSENKNRGNIRNEAVRESRTKDDGEWSENEINNVKDMQSYFSFLRKKKGNSTNRDLLFKNPIETITKSTMDEEPFTDKYREKKQEAGCVDGIGTKTKLMQESRTDLVYPGNALCKVKNMVHMPKTPSEVIEQRLNERLTKKFRLFEMSSELTKRNLISKPTKENYGRISPSSWEMTEQSFHDKPTKKKSIPISQISSEVTEQSFNKNPTKKKSVRISPVPSEIPKKRIIEKPAKKKPMCMPQVSSGVTDKSSTEKLAKIKSKQEKKDPPVFNRSMDLFKQLNQEIQKKTIKKRTPVALEASTSADMYSKYHY